MVRVKVRLDLFSEISIVVFKFECYSFVVCEFGLA